MWPRWDSNPHGHYWPRDFTYYYRFLYQNKIISNHWNNLRYILCNSILFCLESGLYLNHIEICAVGSIRFKVLSYKLNPYRNTCIFLRMWNITFLPFQLRFLLYRLYTLSIYSYSFLKISRILHKNIHQSIITLARY